MPRSSKRRSNVIDDDESDDEPQTEMAATIAMTFSSQAPALTQDIGPARESDQRNLMNMSDEKREKAILDTARLVLFKAMAGLPIDRPKCMKEAGVSDARISTAVFKEVDERLQNCFGFGLSQMPDWMKEQKGIPKGLKDRYYVTNKLVDDTGEHTRALHAIHKPAQKGFLMVVLALCYCEGTARADGSRWIPEQTLYRFLHRLDDSLPAVPPATTAARRATQASSSQSHEDAPNPEVLLHLFVHLDYLVKEKGELNDEECLFYSMGPRAALEIGNEQILNFCAEILGEEIDPVMLQEVRAMENMEEQEAH